MDAEGQLGGALIQLIQNMNRANQVTEGVIKDVDEVKYTCTITIWETEFLVVPLRVLIGSNASIVEIPAIGTNCLVCFRDNDINRPQLFSVDQSKRIEITASELIKFNGGTLGGLPISSKLVTEINKIITAFNALNVKVNALAPTPVITPLEPITVPDIANNKITQ